MQPEPSRYVYWFPSWGGAGYTDEGDLRRTWNVWSVVQSSHVVDVSVEIPSETAGVPVQSIPPL